MHSALSWKLFFLELVPFFLWFFCSQWSLSHSAIVPIPLAIKCSSLACVHPAGEIATCQGINEHPNRAKPPQRSLRPSYFYLANKGLFLLIVCKHRGEKIIHLLHGYLFPGAGLPAPLLFLLWRFPWLQESTRIWSCAGYPTLHKPECPFCIGGEDIIESLWLRMWVLDGHWERKANGLSPSQITGLPGENLDVSCQVAQMILFGSV